MRANLSLPQMVDLALGTPEVGAVNFNVLHTLLHALIHKLDLTDSRAAISEEDREFLARKQHEFENISEAAAEDGAKSVADSGIDGTTGSTTGSERDSSASKRGKTAVFKTPYHRLEDKVAKLEQELELLNALPSNNELLERMRYRGDGEKVRPMSDMWQTMQITRKVDANEEGVGKLMSLVEDLMNELAVVKEANEKLKTQLSELNPENQLKELDDKIKKLEELMNSLNERMTCIDEATFVTWNGLEESLKGIRQELEPKQNIVLEKATSPILPERSPTPQPPPREPTPAPARPVSPPSRPSSSIPVTKQPSRTSTPGPSQELQDLLEKLGHLTNKHDKLQVQVDGIELELQKKADKEDLVGLGGAPTPEIPDDLLDQLKSMMSEIESFKQSRDKLLHQLNELERVQAEVGVSRERQEEAAAGVRGELREVTEGLAARVQSARELASAAAIPEDTLHQALDVYVKEYEDELDLPAKINHDDNSISTTLKNRETLVQEVRKILVQEVRKNLDGHVVFTQHAELAQPHKDVPTTKTQGTETMPLVPVETPVKSPEPLLAIKPAPPRDNEFMEEILRIQKLEQDLHAKAEQLTDLDRRVQGLAQESGLQLGHVKDRVKQLERDLAAIRAEQTRVDVVQVLENTAPSAHPDSEALSRMQQLLLNLQAEVERIAGCCDRLISDTQRHQGSIDELFNLTRTLEQVKADKDFVQSEVDVKADKRHLENKVNRKLFDSTTDELNKMIEDLLRKLTGQEDEWRKCLGSLTSDLDGKLDRLEFGPIRDELERQLRALARQLKSMDIQRDTTEDDAAGIRRQLIQRYHCISCDRQVDMMPQGPIPAIPATPGLPGKPSTRPYTTYELDQVRQSARSQVQCTKYAMYHPQAGSFSASMLGRTKFDRLMYERYKDRVHLRDCRNTLFRFIPQLRPVGRIVRGNSYNAQHVDVMDLYSTNRACGGSHTTTFPHRRVTRATALNNFFREDGSGAVPVAREELDIMGADGHIYRGRADDQRLPELPQTAPGMVSAQNRGNSPQGGPIENGNIPHRPNTPHSARAQRIQSAGTQRRSGSVAPQVPTGRDDPEGQSGPGQPHTTTPVPPST